VEAVRAPRRRRLRLRELNRNAARPAQHVRTVFEPARNSAGLPAVRFHDLRHSYASMLIAQGKHPKEISEQLGHASISITMDRYSHLLDRSWTDVGDAVEKARAASGTASTDTPNSNRGCLTGGLLVRLQPGELQRACYLLEDERRSMIASHSCQL
jgi:hypothetical protein